MVDAYRSGWIAAGPRTTRLEEAICEYTGAGHAVAVSSGTAALHLACLAVGLGPGTSAVVPSLTFVATVNAVAHTGASVRFADVAGTTEPWLTVSSVERALAPDTKAIMAVSYGGHLGETEGLAELAADRGITLIEDAAHAAGSWSTRGHAGTIGDAGALSFSASKNLGVGEGGMLLTREEEMAARARSLSWHGIRSSIWERHHGDAPEYELGETGFNYRFDDPRAALVLARLERLDEENDARAVIDSAYRDALDGNAAITPTAPPAEQERSSHYLFTAVLAEEIDRTAFRSSLASRGVQTSVHFPPAHQSGAQARHDLSLPVTEEYARRTVSLPIFPEMEEWQRDLVIEATEGALRAAAGSAAA